MEHKSLMPPETPESKYTKLFTEVEQLQDNESPVALEKLSQLLFLELQQKKTDAKRLVYRLTEGLKKSKLVKFDWPLDGFLKSDVELLYSSNQTLEARLLVSAMLDVYSRDVRTNFAPTDGFFNQARQDFKETQRVGEEFIKLVEMRRDNDPEGMLMMYAFQLNFDVREKSFSSTPIYTKKISNIVASFPRASFAGAIETFGYSGMEYQDQKMYEEAEKVFKKEIELEAVASVKEPAKRPTKGLRRLANLYQKENWEKSKQLMLDAVNIGVETLPPIKKYLGPDIKLVVLRYLDLHDLNRCDETISQIDTLTPDWPETAIRSDYWTEQKLSYDFEKFQSWERAAYWINKVVEINTQQKDVGTAVMNLKRCATDLEKAGHPDKASQCIQQAKQLEDDFKKAHGGRW